VFDHIDNSPESSVEAIRYFEKRTSLLLHRLALLEDRLQEVEEVNMSARQGHVERKN
jgi:hypothetical protein